jgi:hypothetical protein
MKAQTQSTATPIDVHAPDLIATLNRRAEQDHAALVRDLKELAEKQPGDFILLLFEAMPDGDAQEAAPCRATKGRAP